MAIDNAKNEDIKLNFINGFAEARLLEGVYPDVEVYRGKILSKCDAVPEIYDRAHQIIAFTSGTGYITTPGKAYNITELSFFIAELGQPFKIHAVEDLVYTKFVVKLSDHDMEVYNSFHIVLPYFLPISQAQEYYQSCKTPGTRSWTVLATKRLNRCLMGVVKSPNGGGTFEKGHPAVAQWNVILDDADMKFAVQGKGEVEQHPGDVSYVLAGLDHQLYAEPGKCVHYIWFEHYVQDIDYIVTNPHFENVESHD